MASGDKPVNILSWRKLRWLKRRSFVVISANVGPSSLGRPPQGVDCGGDDANVVAILT